MKLPDEVAHAHTPGLMSHIRDTYESELVGELSDDTPVKVCTFQCEATAPNDGRTAAQAEPEVEDRGEIGHAMEEGLLGGYSLHAPVAYAELEALEARGHGLRRLVTAESIERLQPDRFTSTSQTTTQFHVAPSGKRTASGTPARGAKRRRSASKQGGDATDQSDEVDIIDSDEDEPAYVWKSRSGKGWPLIKA